MKYKLTKHLFARLSVRWVTTLILIASITACGDGGTGNQTSNGGNSVSGGSNGVTKAWGAPVLLENESGIANSPAVSADRLTNNQQDGTVIAVWSQYDGVNNNRYSIYASRYDGGWSPPTEIEHEAVDQAYSPRVAMNDYGQANILWQYKTGTSYSIWSNTYSPYAGLAIPSSSWGTPEALSKLISGNANSPQLSFDTHGFYVFSVWSQYAYGNSTYNYYIQQRRYRYPECVGQAICDIPNPQDFGWLDQTMLSPFETGDASEPQVAGWGTQNAFSVWTQNTSAGNQIWANLATTGSWGTAVRINTGSSNGAAAPMVAVDGNGNAFVVWLEFASTRKTLYASRYTANTTSWSAPVPIDDTAGGDSSDYGPPRHAIVMDASGNALLVWRQDNADSSETNIYARRCPGGLPSSCGAPVLLEHSTGYADLPALAIAPNGDAIAVWKQDDNGARRIYANHYSFSGDSWDVDASLVGGADGNWNEGPQIAIDGSGNATVVWTEYEAGQYNIYANRYE